MDGGKWAWAARLKERVSNAIADGAYGVSAGGIAFLLPLLLFLGLTGGVARAPEQFSGPLEIDLKLPSEAAIPQAVAVRAINESDPAWRFRFAETGTEFRAGIPYWIFRIMPKIFPEVFQGKGYDHFGFTEEEHDYYSTRPVPRGMALSSTSLRSPLLKARFSLMRVSINCSGCHRGEYLDGRGERVLVDGMPNHTADLQGFKRFFASAFQDPRFEAERVIAEIDKALAEEGHGPLAPREQVLYVSLVLILKDMTRVRASAWMDPPRADNGPGRIDPFNAVKFEVLNVPDDHTVATLDFPSVWNQRPAMRPWHHADGNTDDSSARNFGSVIGVGGIPSAVNKQSVTEIGAWFDKVPPPRYPFTPPAAESVARGAEAFQKACAHCHGVYDRASNSIDTKNSPMYMQIALKVGTDPERWQAFPNEVASKLNGFGALHSLWRPDAFRGSAIPGGYLCGPLDGIWARAPYLHNGSVPNIAELLKTPEERVKVFFRGNRHYDETNLGWVSDQDNEAGRPLFRYDTAPAGNTRVGHPYTVGLEERPYLIDYLKTL